MMSRKEVIEYFDDKGFSEEAIAMVLNQLKVDSTSTEFDESIIEQVEAVLDTVNGTVKALPHGLEKTDALAHATASSTTAIQRLNITIDPQSIALLVRASLPEIIATADAIADVQRQVLIKRIDQNNQGLVEELTTAMINSSKTFNASFNSSTINAMVESTVPTNEQIDINTYIAEISRLENANSNKTKPSEKGDGFNLDQYMEWFKKSQ